MPARSKRRARHSGRSPQRGPSVDRVLSSALRMQVKVLGSVTVPAPQLPPGSLKARSRRRHLTRHFSFAATKLPSFCAITCRHFASTGLSPSALAESSHSVNSSRPSTRAWVSSVSPVANAGQLPPLYPSGQSVHDLIESLPRTLIRVVQVPVLPPYGGTQSLGGTLPFCAALSHLTTHLV